jgi:hypothetical protein
MFVVLGSFAYSIRFLQPAMAAADRVWVHSMRQILGDTNLLPPNAACVWVRSIPGTGTMKRTELVASSSIGLNFD